MDSSWPVEIRPIGLAACGSVVWRFRRQIRVTAVVKATFSFVPDGPMNLEEPDDLHRADIHHGGDPAASVWAGSDVAPFRLLADVVAVGHAYVPPTGGAVRLAVFQGRKPLIDKSIQVAGAESNEAGQVRPVPLVYERALGGRNSSDNPVGTGKRAGSPLPDLIDPADPRRTVGFGPIARTWPRRARLLGALPAGALEQGVPEVPSDFDWAYFQAAPPGQTTEFLRGDEWIVLENMNPEHPLLQTYLPGAIGAGRIYGLGGADARPVPIAFRADNLHIDADRGRCSVTWRASFSVPDEAALATLVLLAGVEFAGYPISWPDAVRIQPPALEEFIDVVMVDEPSVVDDPSTEEAEFGMATVAMEPRPQPQPAATQGRQSTVLMSWGEGGAPPLAPRAEPAPSEPPPAPRRRQSTVLLEWSQGGPPGVAAQEPAEAAASGRSPTVVLAWSDGVVPQPLPPPAAPPPPGQLPTEVLKWGDGVVPPALPARTVAGATAPNVPDATAPAPRARRAPTEVLEWSGGVVPPPLQGPPPPSAQAAAATPGAAAPAAPVASGRAPTVVLDWGGAVPQALAANLPRVPLATVALDWGEGGAPDASHLIGSTPSAVAMPDDDSPLMGTLAFTDEQASTPMPMPSPFRIAMPGAARPEPASDIPGAPWAHGASPLVPRPREAEETRSLILRETLILPDDVLEPEASTERLQVKAATLPPVSEPIRTPVPPPLAPTAAAAAAVAAGEAGGEGAKERSWSWATVAEPPRLEIGTEKPAAPKPIPKVVVKNSLYGKFAPGKKK